jgi:ATP-dependent RNA circularization protein (DNA/RNA ligase family)
MNTYHKINSLYKRDPVTQKFIQDLSDNEVAVIGGWIGEEQIDGTNIRVNYDPVTKIVTFGGRTEDAQIPANLFKFLQQHFQPELFKEFEQEVTLYGEGVGKKIKKDSHLYLPEGQDYGFILFDVEIGGYLVDIAAVTEIASRMGVPRATIMIVGSLDDAEKLVKIGFVSSFSSKKMAEGLVIKTPMPVYNKYGKRIITKLKYVDFHPKTK